jgi:membrane fusion protein, multidrug efflux system
MAQQAASRRDTARAALARDTGAETTAEQQVGIVKAQLAKAEAVLQHDLAVQKQAELNVAYTSIVAPIAGVIGNRSLRTGQYVQAGTQLMAVVPLASTYVVANFEETQLAGMRNGQPADLIVDSYSANTVKGYVDSIAPASGQVFLCCRPIMLPATLRRSYSAFRSRLRSTRMICCVAICGQACRLPPRLIRGAQARLIRR